MTDEELKEFLVALERATTAFQTEGILWSQLIQATTGQVVLPFDPSNPIQRRIVDSMSRAANALIDSANSTQMVGWDVRRVNELGNALEERFSRVFNELNRAARIMRPC